MFSRKITSKNINNICINCVNYNKHKVPYDSLFQERQCPLHITSNLVTNKDSKKYYNETTMCESNKKFYNHYTNKS